MPLRTSPLRTLLLTIACVLPILASADDLIIPVGQQGADKASLELPLRAMKAEAVEEKFGAPLNKSNPVGNPPISNWEYPAYRVFFESDRVLHTVLKPISDEPAVIPEAEAPVQDAPVEATETPTEAPTPEAPAQVE